MRLPPQTSAWAERARHHVVKMLNDGSLHYIDNAQVALSLLRVDDLLLPVVITLRNGEVDPSRPAAAVVSPSAHYSSYNREMLDRLHSSSPNWVLSIAFTPLNTAIRLGDIESVVHVNNWLLTTNPRTLYSQDQLVAIIGCLKERHSSAAIVFRGLMPELHSKQFSLFKRVGFQMVRYRKVWVVKDCKRACNESPELRRDLRLLERHKYEIVDDPGIIADNAERIAHLYRNLYLDKYSLFNLHYNAEFIRLTLRRELLTYRAFRKNGSIDAFKAWYIRDGMMTGAFVGYDRQKPRTLGLYRQAMALQLSEAARLGLNLHLSAGVGKFKALRGADPHWEYEAVWNKHLSLRRRLPWAMLSWAMRGANAIPWQFLDRKKHANRQARSEQILSL